MNLNLLKELEARNHYLDDKFKELTKEQVKNSRRVSDIQFTLIGIKGEIEANKRIIKKLKENK